MESLRESAMTGVSFGLVSGVITTLGLMSGLYAGTHSVKVVVGGVITIAVADAMSDALGIHVAEESRNVKTSRQIWVSTIVTFLAKFLVAISFLVPILLLELPVALMVSIAWGIGIISLLSYRLARQQGGSAGKVIAEHVSLTVAVILLTGMLGDWVAGVFE